ncbi:MAG: hypothetical protein ABIG39_04395 [Candidatus Micrarchaeota archaeon]
MALAQKKKQENQLILKIGGNRLHKALGIFYREIDSANKLFLEGAREIANGDPKRGAEFYQKAKQKFDSIAECYSSPEIPVLASCREFSATNVKELPRKTEEGEIRARVHPHFVYQYATAMAGMIDCLSVINLKLAEHLVGMWNAGTGLENVVNSDNKDRVKDIRKDMEGLARAADQTLKDVRETGDRMDGEELNRFKGVEFQSERYGTAGTTSNPLYVAENRYLRMLEWNDGVPREDPTVDSLSTIVPKKK